MLGFFTSTFRAVKVKSVSLRSEMNTASIVQSSSSQRSSVWSQCEDGKLFISSRGEFKECSENRRMESVDSLASF